MKVYIQKQTRYNDVTKEDIANNISVIALAETCKWETEGEEIKISECKRKDIERLELEEELLIIYSSK